MAHREHLGDVTCTEDFVNSGEFLRLVWGEIRGERALFGTSPPQKLTRRARRYVVERPGAARAQHHVPSSHFITISCILLSLDLLCYLVRSFPSTTHPHHHTSQSYEGGQQKETTGKKDRISRYIQIDVAWTVPVSGHSSTHSSMGFLFADKAMERRSKGGKGKRRKG